MAEAFKLETTYPVRLLILGYMNHLQQIPMVTIKKANIKFSLVWNKGKISLMKTQQLPVMNVLGGREKALCSLGNLKSKNMYSLFYYIC